MSATQLGYGATGVTVRFGDTEVLAGITVDILPGQVVAVVGGDGAGKTTLMRTLVGEIVPTRGEVRIPAKEQLGYLPASTGSWLELSVQENMEFVAGAYGLRGDERAHRVDGLLAAAGLTDVRDRLSGKLSGGMRRKLGFSLAMTPHPPLLVLDEPSTGVDPVSRVELWRLVSAAASRGAAVIMSTTYLDEAERAESLLVLDRGRPALQGTPTEVMGALTGVVTSADRPVRSEWAWRRGRAFHEYWPDPEQVRGDSITPDLEDVVIATSLLLRAGGAA